jgi:hypothetical protein
MLPIHFAERIQSLTAQLHSVVIHWFFSGPAEQLQRLISVYKRIIVMLIEPNQFQLQVRQIRAQINSSSSVTNPLNDWSNSVFISETHTSGLVSNSLLH